MKLFQLFAILLPLIHAAELTYLADGSGDIASFSFAWKNPDRSTAEKTGPVDGTLVTDGDTSTGVHLINPDEGSSLWGSEGASTQGMTGSFVVEALNIASDKLWFQITDASITFTATQAACIGSGSTASVYYTDAQSGAQVILGNAEVTSSDRELTFTAQIPSAGIITKGGIGFDVATNSFCFEAELYIVEFVLEGVAIDTPEPTPNPTK
eukprot:238371_1